MTTPWERVDRLLKQRKLTWSQLAIQIGYAKHPDQVVNNWKVRGLPLKEYEPIAVFLRESMDWIAGIAPPRSEDASKLTAMAVKVAQEFDTINELSGQLDAFAKIVTIIAKIRGT